MSKSSEITNTYNKTPGQECNANGERKQLGTTGSGAKIEKKTKMFEISKIAGYRSEKQNTDKFLV